MSSRSVRARFSDSPSHRRRGSARTGFTLIEVLATMFLMALLLPVIMEGISLGSGVADTARHRTEAAGLAEMQLNSMVSSGSWNSGEMEGGFDQGLAGQEWANDYGWRAELSPWPTDEDLNETVYQLTVIVSWTGRNGRDEDSISLSTLVYDRYDQYDTYQANLQNASSGTTSGTTVGG